jgi:hypothetical protein
MKPVLWCLKDRCSKPRRYSGDSSLCLGCGTPFPKRPKRGKPIRAIPAFTWMLFGGDGKQFGAVYLSRPTRGAIAHAYATHFLGRSWSESPVDYYRAQYAGVRVKRFRVTVGR